MIAMAIRGMNIRSLMSQMNGHDQGPRRNDGEPHCRFTEFLSHGWVHESRIAGPSNERAGELVPMPAGYPRLKLPPCSRSQGKPFHPRHTVGIGAKSAPENVMFIS